MSFVLGLTGPTGAGKSIFAGCAKSLGFNVIDCDVKAREAVKKGAPALTALTEVFGEEILLENGELDRRKLAETAFSSKEKTELLNKTVLPYIVETVKKEIKGDFVLLDAPTLFESGADKMCDAIVAVVAPESIRKKRIIERDKIDESAAAARIHAGKPEKFYFDNAGKVFINDGNVENFIKQVKIYLSDIIGGTENE